MEQISDLTGWGLTATMPSQVFTYGRSILKAFSPGNHLQGAMDFLATLSRVIDSKAHPSLGRDQYVQNKRPGVIQVSQSSSGASVIGLGAYSHALGSTIGYGFSSKAYAKKLEQLLIDKFYDLKSDTTPEEMAQRIQSFTQSFK